MQRVPTGALERVVLGGQGLGVRGRWWNRSDQDICLARHVPHEHPPNPLFFSESFG
jgi:hypothetical protein